MEYEYTNKREIYLTVPQNTAGEARGMGSIVATYLPYQVHNIVACLTSSCGYS
jgi:hypothetical protein